MSKRWKLLIFVVGALACACAAPLSDLPETAYNEVDTPVNHAPPAVRDIRLVPPLSFPAILPKELGEQRRDLTTSGLEVTASLLTTHHQSNSIHDLLCTFLI